ncbi:unnamed protein product [Vitrella brassicaformis CCMP3155]|uniref:Uncharacterized protein n=1 Tax=Vitrella brassicaformis (strain CCMP3155) TaxID=1169540 RepID=A0A0G4EDC1_VITBC|nr:unnamed protein product [Vitrella brassicaformis CCMP3155]|eukprot:CEL93353.1 unnamed protein product [Vitrella brassicaformis CCMP3155]
MVACDPSCLRQTPCGSAATASPAPLSPPLAPRLPSSTVTSLRPLRSARWSGLLANCSPVVGLPAMPADASSDAAPPPPPIEAKVEVLEIDGERVGQAALAKRTDGLEDEDPLSVSVADNDEDSSQPPEGDAPEGAEKRREGTKDTQGSAAASSAPFGDPSTQRRQHLRFLGCVRQGASRAT